MLRTLVLLLIFANIAFLAWSHGWLRAAGIGPAPVTEPQRLRQQIHPDALALLPGAASAASAAPSASAAGRAPRAASAASSAAAAAANPSAAAVASSAPGPSGAAIATTDCLQLGPYAKASADVTAVLLAAGLKPVERHASPPAQWMVLVGPLPDARTLRHQLTDLQRIGLKSASFAAVIDRPRYMPGISLGVFSTKAAARQQLTFVQGKGVTGAHLVQRNAGYEATYLVLPNLDPAQSRALRTINPARLYNHKPEACTVG